ncbi:AraC family transcriptional regulator [Actinomadura decatromicini]|uniref:Helix-turn-helix transcriptional regulator n=1 Tax=Actinomadura decatromicini TaxID=2604572 RepID=A0A5D3F7G1_9ACTN|nr:helix-turn-helix domain-containing protein [Actinomadura decatromicini]TYK43756.1 helix-turn-helix transcriptional regulator [Actinomadura decatromicini]
MGQVHSVLVRAGAEPCATRARPAAPRLRPFAAGYGAFRIGTAGPAPRRVLPLNLVTVIVDLAGRGALVFGARGAPLVHAGASWERGVTVGLTPAGVRALFGTPMSALTGAVVPLDDLLGRSRTAELEDRLSTEPGWTARLSLLDGLLAEWLSPDGESPDAPAARAWWRIHEVAGQIKVGPLAAELGIGRRRLETGFQREFGLSPKTVARVARFQRAASVLGAPSGDLGTAAACGFADQPHFTREVRTMAGVTPTELRAILQYTGPLDG